MMMMLWLWVVVLPLFSAGAVQNGTPQLSCSGLINENGVIDLCEVTSYYYCRCVVTESTRLQWSVNGIIERNIFPFNKPSDFFPDPKEPLNILIQSVDSSDNFTDANFTSLLWFEYNYLENVTIQCASPESSSTKMFERPGLTEVPTQLNVSYCNRSEDSVTARYGWKYSGDLGSVSYFQVVVEANNMSYCQKKVLKSIQEVTCLLPFKEGDKYTVTVAVIDNCNISGPPLTKMFMADFDQLNRTEDGSFKQEKRGDCLVWQGLLSLVAVLLVVVLLVVVVVLVPIIVVLYRRLKSKMELAASKKPASAASAKERKKNSAILAGIKMELAASKKAASEASAALAEERKKNSDMKAAHSKEMKENIATALQKERQKSQLLPLSAVE